MPRQTSMQLTEATERQIEALKAQGFGNFTDIVRIAVDRMYQQEVRTMSNHITYTTLEAAVAAGYIPAGRPRVIEEHGGYRIAVMDATADPLAYGYRHALAVLAPSAGRAARCMRDYADISQASMVAAHSQAVTLTETPNNMGGHPCIIDMFAPEDWAAGMDAARAYIEANRAEAAHHAATGE